MLLLVAASAIAATAGRRTAAPKTALADVLQHGKGASMVRRSMFAAVAGLALAAVATNARAEECNAKVLTGLWSGGSNMVFPSESCSLHIDKSNGKISGGHCWPLGSIYPVDLTGRLSVDKKCDVTADVKIDAGRLGKFTFKLKGDIKFHKRGYFNYKYINLKSDKNSMSLSQVNLGKRR